MRDTYLTPPLPEVSKVTGLRTDLTQYQIGYLEVPDIQEFAPKLLALYGLHQEAQRVAQEEDRLFELLRRAGTDIMVARPADGVALAADARVMHPGRISMGPTDGRRVADGLFSIMKWRIDPKQYPLNNSVARYFHSY
jgi:hypothetical protein